MFLKTVVVAISLSLVSTFAQADGDAKSWDGYTVVKQAYFLQDASRQLDRRAHGDEEITWEMRWSVRNMKLKAERFAEFVKYNNKSAAQSARVFDDAHEAFHKVRDEFTEFDSEEYANLIENVHTPMHELHGFYK